MSIDRKQQVYLLHFDHNLECIVTKKYSFVPLCSFHNVILICRIFRNYMLTCYSQNYFYHSSFLLSQVLYYHNLQTWLETSVSLDFKFSLPYIPIPSFFFFPMVISSFKHSSPFNLLLPIISASQVAPMLMY